MKENVDKYLDGLTRKVIKDASTESPSLDFTSLVMSKVTVLNDIKVTAYKPLISRKTWVLFSIGVLVLTAYLIFGVETESSAWFSALDFSGLSNNKLTNALTGITISKSFMYSIVFFAILFFIQVPFLKNHLDKRLEY